MLPARGYPDLDAAFEALRGTARAQRRRLDAVARAVVEDGTESECAPVPEPRTARGRRR